MRYRHRNLNVSAVVSKARLRRVRSPRSAVLICCRCRACPPRANWPAAGWYTW